MDTDTKITITVAVTRNYHSSTIAEATIAVPAGSVGGGAATRAIATVLREIALDQQPTVDPADECDYPGSPVEPPAPQPADSDPGAATEHKPPTWDPAIGWNLDAATGVPLVALPVPNHAVAYVWRDGAERGFWVSGVMVAAEYDAEDDVRVWWPTQAPAASPLDDPRR